LKHREGSSGEVEKNVSYAPSNGTLSSIVHHSLWNVFNESNGKFDVAASIEEVKPVPNTESSDTECHNHDSEEGSEDAPSNI
jgi:hypothetical protein